MPSPCNLHPATFTLQPATCKLEIAQSPAALERRHGLIGRAPPPPHQRPQASGYLEAAPIESANRELCQLGW
eukprot:CAMPEP_0171538144 /NCGR_PEP_ID=MMETSP0959-20130129/18958_1 /TAXON_ID=87120 /ORGANISM="Aurantiochytrium limacinum, Strain ATCCMYA-1381" /LENGTH=71 /DNA_ID=CAMNT_0012084991 /DNA_START=629 /DNA_END=841 /DNA_ORIENTATION=+